jgi:hypothetical protein
MISPGHRSRLQSNWTDTGGVSEESVTSLESDWERSRSLGNVSRSVKVAEVKQGEKEGEGKT